MSAPSASCDCWKALPKGADWRARWDDSRFQEHEPASDCIVGCDDDCRALLSPVTIDELRAALAHWEDHAYLSGCSHGC